MKPKFTREPDRIDRNKSDGQVFIGFDSEDGTTTWYNDRDGSLDSITKTPNDDE